MAGMNLPGSFVLLSGPGGFGKTTLLSEFTVQLRQPVAWVSLDEGDNDLRWGSRGFQFELKARMTSGAIAGPLQACGPFVESHPSEPQSGGRWIDSPDRSGGGNASTLCDISQSTDRTGPQVDQKLFIFPVDERFKYRRQIPGRDIIRHR
jgi:hypothetical protein